jgi:hypothetical protein
MSRGHKVCPSCEKTSGAKSINCKFCGHRFVFKTKSEKSTRKIVKPKTPKKKRKPREPKPETTIQDWRQLQKGDMIVVKGGPYFINKDDIKNPVKVPMGEKGLFKVAFIEKDGIIAYPKGKKHECHGTHFIYMGEKQLSSTGVFRKAHRIRYAILKRNLVYH